jgi:hypothetical protein
LKAIISFEAEQVKKAQSLVRATVADNNSTPKYLRIRSSASGRMAKFSIRTSRLDTLVATVDDLLSCIQAAEKSIEAVQKSKLS